MKKETKGQSAEIQLNRPPLSLIQAAPFLKKKEGTQERQQPGTETETDCPFVSFMELFLQSTVLLPPVRSNSHVIFRDSP